MDTVLIVFLACLLDPIRLVPSFIAGAMVRSWKGVFIASAVIAIIMIGLAVSLGANANPVLGPLATLVAVAGAFAIKAGFRKPKKPQTDVAE